MKSLKLEYHAQLIARLQLEKASNLAIKKKVLKRMAKYYKHDYKTAKITAKRVGLIVA